MEQVIFTSGCQTASSRHDDRQVSQRTSDGRYQVSRRVRWQVGLRPPASRSKHNQVRSAADATGHERSHRLVNDHADQQHA